MAETKEIMVKYSIGDEEIKLTPAIVKEYIIGNKSADITMQEFKFFTSLCKARKLNPFLKEVHCIKYGNNPATIVVGKDAILKRATLHPQFDGFRSGVIVKDETGKIINRDGCFKLDSDELVGAWCEVFRKDWSKSLMVSYPFSEINQSKNPSWQKQPCLMSEKVAIVRGLRTAFVEDLGGMYDDDELQHPANDGFSETDVINSEPAFAEEDVIETNTNEINLEDL